MQSGSFPHHALYAKKPDEPVAALLDEIFLRLNRRDVPYALLHQERSAYVRSDVDLGVLAHPIDTIDPILRELAEDEHMLLVHRLHYEIPYGFYYILAVPGRPFQFLHLDCLFDPIGVNRYYLPTPYLLEGRVIRDGVPCISRDKEALYLLMKRVVKRRCSEEEFEILKTFLSNESHQFQDELRRWFGRHGRADVHALLHSEGEPSRTHLLNHLHRLLHRRYALLHFIRFIRSWQLHLLRILRRARKPTGYFIVIVGPDGSGKSTVAAALGDELKRAFRRVWRFHWRPHLLPRLSRADHTSDASSNPPRTSRYTGAVSLARFLYYWSDFMLGYWFHVYRRTAQTTLVIGERYFLDVIVNPHRYGFAVPRWLVRLASRCVPVPDLTVLLHNAPEVIHARKPELTHDAIANQLRAFHHELPDWGRSVIVPTYAEPAAVASVIASTILRDCGKRIG